MRNTIVELLDTVAELRQQLKHQHQSALSARRSEVKAHEELEELRQQLKHQRQCTLRARESEDRAHEELKELTREFDILEGACEFWQDEATERGYDQGETNGL